MRKKWIVSVLLLSLLQFSFADTGKKSLTIIFFPVFRGNKNASFVIYDNENENFSDFVIQKIRKSNAAHFYTLDKHRCEEGFYKIILNINETVYEYEVFAKNIIYDVKRGKYVKCDILPYIYAYLAKKQLESVVNEKLSFQF